MSRRFSISFRLTCWFSAIFLCGFLIFGTVMWFDLEWSLSAGRDRTLNNRAHRLTELLKTFRGEEEMQRRTQWDNFVDATPEGNFIQVWDVGGKRLLPPADRPAMAFPWPRLSAQDQYYLGKAMYEGRHYRVLSRVVQVGRNPERLLIAGQLEDNRLNMAHFSEGLVWATPALLAVSAMAGYFLSRRALTPIDRLIASARSITIGNLSRRLPVSESGDELARLAETCNEMLARLETAVGQITRFTADASHELRSPLAYIRTVAECALRAPDLSAEAAQSFREIVSESEHATLLLGDMLLLARSDSGHADTAFETVDLCDVVREVTTKIRSRAEEQEQRLSLRLNGGLSYITGDATKLRRLFWILIENAIKYTPRGGKITVSITRNDGVVVVAVRDNGRGIPQDSLPRIFERFFRVDAARQQEGSGLGLAIAKWIADVHLARLTVESAEGIGSTFRVQFSLTGAEEEQAVAKG